VVHPALVDPSNVSVVPFIRVNAKEVPPAPVLSMMRPLVDSFWALVVPAFAVQAEQDNHGEAVF